MEPTSLPPDPSAPSVPPDADDGSAPGIHVTTFTHEGRFWDVHLEFVDEGQATEFCRGRLCYIPTDQADHEEPIRTAVIFIEPSYEEVRQAALALDRYNLAALLRSVT
ncbi:MAG: hypothetical protein OXN18_01215 [Gemmatimonadota bacterium]|nr:hypothetical protein [Gemmatimonadota bacterium]